MNHDAVARAVNRALNSSPVQTIDAQSILDQNGLFKGTICAIP